MRADMVAGVVVAAGQAAAEEAAAEKYQLGAQRQPCHDSEKLWRRQLPPALERLRFFKPDGILVRAG